jgi:hypothetical protein
MLHLLLHRAIRVGGGRVELCKRFFSGLGNCSGWLFRLSMTAKAIYFGCHKKSGRLARGFLEVPQAP